MATHKHTLQQYKAKSSAAQFGRKHLVWTERNWLDAIRLNHLSLRCCAGDFGGSVGWDFSDALGTRRPNAKHSSHGANWDRHHIWYVLIHLAVYVCAHMSHTHAPACGHRSISAPHKPRAYHGMLSSWITHAANQICRSFVWPLLRSTDRCLTVNLVNYSPVKRARCSRWLCVCVCGTWCVRPQGCGWFSVPFCHRLIYKLLLIWLKHVGEMFGMPNIHTLACGTKCGDIHYIINEITANCARLLLDILNNRRRQLLTKIFSRYS